jgi:hypothetical protein
VGRATPVPQPTVPGVPTTAVTAPTAVSALTGVTAPTAVSALTAASALTAVTALTAATALTGAAALTAPTVTTAPTAGAPVPLNDSGVLTFAASRRHPAARSPQDRSSPMTSPAPSWTATFAPGSRP